MRLDYIMYILAVLLLAATLLPFIVEIEGVGNDTRTILAVAAAALALISLGLGYSQRPRTKSQTCEQWTFITLIKKDQ